MCLQQHDIIMKIEMKIQILALQSIPNIYINILKLCAVTDVLTYCDM